jgi:hypothetical protein
MKWLLENRVSKKPLKPNSDCRKARGLASLLVSAVMMSALASALTTPASDYYCISSPLDYDNLHYYSSSEHCALKDLYI